MDENETAEHIRNEGDKNEDNSEIDCDKNSKKRFGYGLILSRKKNLMDQ